MAPITSSPAAAGARLVAAILILAAVFAAGAVVEAASVSVSWNAPTTNADGTPLTDLAGYRIYLGTAAPTCPGASFHEVASSTSAPSPGDTVSTSVTALSAGTTYFARVTAVDLAGNESSCSSAASGVAQADFSVTPSASVSFGSVAVGSTVDSTFTVQNTSGLSLSVVVSVGAPFSVVSGAALSLPPGASQAVTVRFQPTAAGSSASNVTFVAGGDSVSRGVSGSAIAGASATLSVTRNGTGTGTVTSSPAGIACGTSCAMTVSVGTSVTLTASADSGSIFAGWSGACGGTGTCTVTVSAATAVTTTFNTSPTTSPPPAVPPSTPPNPSITQVAADASGVTFAVAWASTTGAASYGYMSAFNDGTASQQGTVTATSMQLRMPYHASGAASSMFVCVWSIGATGQRSADQSCSGATVPATPAASPAPAVPVVSSLSPASTVAGAAGLTLTVNGSRFVAASVVRWNGAARTTTFVSASQLRAAITAADLATPGPALVSVVTPAPGGGTSGNLTFTVTAPVPAVSSLSPASAVVGSTGLTLSVNGSRFVATSVVRWNGAARTTTFVSATQLQAAITTADLATARSVPVSVATPTPGGGTSGNLTFTVTAPVPAVSSLSPASAVAGTTSVTLVVNGSGFVASSGVRWNGVARTTTFLSATQLRAAITTADLATARSVPVTVVTPAPGGGTSASLTFTITPAPPPAAPGVPTVTLTAMDSTGVTFTVAWAAASGATSYRWVAAFNDGSATQQGTVTGRSFSLRMPYHASGAAFGAQVCIRSVNASGLQSADQSCSAVPVPARPPAPPPTTSPDEVIPPLLGWGTG